MDPKAATEEAQALYTWMCRIIEQKVDDPQSKEDLIRITKSCPLYLWSRKKEADIEGYYDDKTIKIFEPMKLPVIMSTHNCCCLLLKQEILNESKIRFEGYLVAHSNDEEEFLTGIYGQLTLTSTADGKFHAGFGAPAIAIFKTEGKHLTQHGDADYYSEMMDGPLGNEFQRMYAEACTAHMMKALELYDYTKKPRVVVVKEEAKKPVKNKKKLTTIPRVHQRDVHIVLDPDQVRILKKEAEDKGTHSSPAPHTRRSHSRTYKDPRYVNVRGQTLSVKECNIGFKEGEEIRTQRRIYHVVSIGNDEV